MLIFANLFVFSQEGHRILSRGLQTTREALDVLETFMRMLEALRQVDIVDDFVNEFVINCVFCITDCVFTGGSA